MTAWTIDQHLTDSLPTILADAAESRAIRHALLSRDLGALVADAARHDAAMARLDAALWVAGGLAPIHVEASP